MTIPPGYEVVAKLRNQSMINCNDCELIDICHTKNPEVRKQLIDHPSDWCHEFQRKNEQNQSLTQEGE